MRKSLRKILLFSLLLVSFTAMAGKSCEHRAKHEATAGSVHHFLNDNDEKGDIEITATTHVLSVHRQHLKNVHDATIDTHSEWLTYAVVAPKTVLARSNLRGSMHLPLIFPFHYFW